MKELTCLYPKYVDDLLLNFRDILVFFVKKYCEI